MKETEDQRIAAKFRQVFDDFEDPASMRVGWNCARSILKKKEGLCSFGSVRLLQY
jgi:hypothetical protein